MASRSPGADARARPDHHAGRVRGPGGLDGHAHRRPRAGWHRPLRLGLQRLLPRFADRHRGGRRRHRSRRAGAAVRGRSRAVRDRPAVGRARAVDAGPRPRPLRPGARRRDDPADRLCRDRADAARIAPSADVRDAVDRVGPARGHRPRDRGQRRRDGRLAVRLPRPPPAHRPRRRAHARSPARDRGRAARDRPGRRRCAPAAPAARADRRPRCRALPDRVDGAATGRDGGPRGARRSRSGSGPSAA